MADVDTALVQPVSDVAQRVPNSRSDKFRTGGVALDKEQQKFPLAWFDLVTLRIFLTVIDTGSIRSAPESLNLFP